MLVSSSWFLVAGLIAVVMAPRVDQLAPGLGPFKYVAGLAFAVILYLSVLLHEASHAYVARSYGHPVRSITLHFLGGMTSVEGEAEEPRQEFWIAVVGPLTSLAVGAAALAVLLLAAPQGLLLMAVEGLAGANLLVGLLNLVPGLPLDGGRVLKSAVWRLTGDPHRGTIAAGWGGRITAALVVAWPVLQLWFLDLRPDVLDFLLAFVVAAFLWTGASAAIGSARRAAPAAAAGRPRPGPPRARRAGGPAARRGRAPGPRGRGRRHLHLPAASGPSAWSARPRSRPRPTSDGPGSPPPPWPATVGDLQLPADIGGESLVEALSRRPASEYLLVEGDGTVLGVLTMADVDRAFRRVTA